MEAQRQVIRRHAPQREGGSGQRAARAAQDDRALRGLSEAGHRSAAPEPLGPGPGLPRILPAVALWAGALVGVIRGFSAQLEIWRLLTANGLWDFPRLAVSDDAVYQRLQYAGRDTFRGLFERVTAVVRGRRPVANHLGSLAAFATGVYALDGMTLEAVTQRLPALRAQPGAVLPGKVAAVFDVRAQQGQTVAVVDDAQAHGKPAA